MKPPPFAYEAPASLDEALALLAGHGDAAKALAGGQSLLPMLNFRLARPAMLVDLNGITELTGIELVPGALRIGAMTRQRVAERSALVREHAPLLAATLPFVAHPQIRNRGTVGGSVAHADPAAELPAVMLALEARLAIRSERGERSMPATEFFTGILSTALEPDELLVALEIPAVEQGMGWAFDEASRRHGDYALFGVAAGIALDAKGVVREARVACVNGGGAPARARAAERSLIGRAPSTEFIREAARVLASEDIDPVADVHASADYRRHLAGVLSSRVLARAAAGATDVIP